MDNFNLHIIPNKKASLIACLLLSSQFLFIPKVFSQQWQFNKKSLEAYTLLLNLHTTEALNLISNPQTAQENYIASLAQAIELLLTEDPKLYTQYEDLFQKRIDRNTKNRSAEELFSQAETHLHWAFVYLKFGHDFDAALHLRKAYRIATACRNEFQEFVAIKKTLGILNIILGAVPEKYNWLLNMMGMEGSIESGLLQLEAIDLTSSPLGLETNLLLALVQTYVLQKPEKGTQIVNLVTNQYPHNRLILLLRSAILIKNSQGEEALKSLDALSDLNEGLPLHLADYLSGEVCVYKAEYSKAITFYQSFIRLYKGKNYVRDANYKIGLCHLLNNDAAKAQGAFRQARNVGEEMTEADRYATRSLADNELPNVKLTKARYYTDGGYYNEADKLLQSITSKEVPSKRDQVEYYYRKARLAHKTKQFAAAKLFYKQTIDMSNDEPWYFAPNSCLQLGYIMFDENDLPSARKYFEKVFSYKKHEYKNSIDSKAKTALAQL